MRDREFNQPLWDGSDLDGKRILLHAEQGFGDTIQFARYAPLVAERGGQVIIEAQSELVRLLQSIQGLDKVIATGQEPGEFDLHAPLISLPAIFQTTLEGIPAKIPYLSVDEELSVRWQERLPTDGLKVGLVWAGRSSHRNDGNRSIPSNALSPLAKVDGVKFISLQKHDAGDEAPKPPRGLNLTDWSADLNDFADTAALVQNLDLVITADTAAAHLAGALGKPVWVLLPFIPDWRWMLARSDSPWYPSMRLFRQTTPGAWDAPIDQVVQELRKLAGE